uniref:protein ZBED8-like n=1 Tax=Styela clava TaxID=7725 RepID=UPI00193A15E2|nr:protein ZBED8-like [Styela clava]
MKRSNVKRHFHTCHTSFASKYPEGDIRKRACLELLRQVKASQQQLRAWSQKGNCNSASFAASLAIVKNGKPFTDGEYAKIFMLDVANELFEDLSNKDTIIKRIKDVPLSARTVHDRAIMMANEVEEIQLKDINTAELFSLAFDESTDVSHLSQFSVIARYVVGDTLREESRAVLPLKGTTRGEDLFRSFMEFATEKKLPIDNLVSVCTDGAPCMMEKNKGFVALLRKYEKTPIPSFHCILHQEALCAQLCGKQFSDVMDVVTSVVILLLPELQMIASLNH